MIENKLKNPCEIYDWLQINYKFHVELIIDSKSSTNSIGIDNWLQISYKFFRNW